MSPKTREWAIPAGMALLAFLGSVTLYYTAKEDSSKADLQEEVDQKAYTKDVRLWDSDIVKEMKEEDADLQKNLDDFKTEQEYQHTQEYKAIQGQLDIVVKWVESKQ